MDSPIINNVSEANSLPKGWKREEVKRKRGVHKGKLDIYITSPRGKIFRSRKELENYIAENKLNLKIEDFNFTLRKKKGSLLDSSSTNSSSVLISQNENTPISNKKFSKPMEAQTDRTYERNNIISNELLGNNWISDITLQPYCQMLNDRFFNSTSSILINPLIVHAVKISKDYNFLLDPFNLEKSNFILMPVNDSEEVNDLVSGSH